MIAKINGPTPPATPTTGTTGREAPAGTRAPGTTTSAAPGADQLSLTPAAERLQALGRGADDALQASEARVARVQELLASGEFSTDSTRIAERLLDLEQALYGPRS